MVVPEADSNHRHADFQSKAIPGKSVASGKNGVKPDAENQRLTEELSNLEILEAARWYFENRRQLTRGFVPVLREKFGLTTLQAIEAAKLAGERHG